MPRHPAPWRRAACRALALGGLCLACTVHAEELARLTGETASPDCSHVAVGLLRARLSYPWLGSLGGFSRGVPSISDVRGELYVYDIAQRKLSLLLSVPAPRAWDDSTRFALNPRYLPDGQLIFQLRGCPKDRPSCTEAQHYRSTGRGGYGRLAAWPEASAEESAQFKRCTAYRTYPEGRTVVNIGPSGGPWQPLLQFAEQRLAPLP